MSISPTQLRDRSIWADLENSSKGQVYADIVAYGSRFITPIYKDVAEEMNRKKFYVRSPRSYAPIQTYFTLPMGEDYLDPFPVAPNGVKATQPIKPNANTTPELLLEPFMDELAYTYHTIMEIFDMHVKKIRYEIEFDADVVTIVNTVGRYIQCASEFNNSGKYEVTSLLTKLSEFKNDLDVLYKRACHRNNWIVEDNSLIRLFNTLGR